MLAELSLGWLSNEDPLGQQPRKLDTLARHALNRCLQCLVVLRIATSGVDPRVLAATDMSRVPSRRAGECWLAASAVWMIN